MTQKTKEEATVVEKLEAKVSEESFNQLPELLPPHIHNMKSKYFAAWRKYTLKKRKQNQQLRDRKCIN